jgi:hypothetical protein
MMAKQAIRPGAVVQVPLGGTLAGYGQVVSKSEVAFFDFFTDHSDQPESALVVKNAVIFIIPVMSSAVKSGRWPVIATAPVTPTLQQPRQYFIQDKLTNELFIYESDTGATRPASFSQVRGLENAAVWEAEHVEDRLRDYLAGKPNQWVKQLNPLSN